jgi:hypothetical protein
MTTPSVIKILLGVWLFISAFLWPHSTAQFNNAWMLGVIVVVAGILSMRGLGWASYVNAAAGAWLFLSSFFLPTLRAGTFWNHLLVGIALFVLAMILIIPQGRRLGRQVPVPPRL